MNVKIISKIVGEILTYDIIRIISSYFIQKIPKDDIILRRIDYFLYKRNFDITKGFYPDGEFCYNLFQPQCNIKRYFLLKVFPKLFIEYYFCIDNRISSIRFWFKDNKCEVPLDGLWIEKKNK